MLGGIVGKTIHDLNTDLLGEGKLNSLASRSSKGSHALLEGFRDNLNLRDSDAFLFREIFAADSWQRDWLVDTGLDRLRIGDGDWWLDNSNNWDVVASLLGDLLAVVVSVSMSVTVSVLSRLAYSHHLSFALFVEGDLNSLGSGFLTLWLVRVGADFVIDLFNALGTDSTSNSVALLDILDVLAGEFYWVANSLQSWGAHFSSLNNIFN